MNEVNRKERLESLNPKVRYFDSNTGDFAQDGYTVLGRRPRSPVAGELMPVEKADAIERIESEMYEVLGNSMLGDFDD